MNEFRLDLKLFLNDLFQLISFYDLKIDVDFNQITWISLGMSTLLIRTCIKTCRVWNDFMLNSGWCWVTWTYFWFTRACKLNLNLSEKLRVEKNRIEWNTFIVIVQVYTMKFNCTAWAELNRKVDLKITRTHKSYVCIIKKAVYKKSNIIKVVLLK